MLMVWLFKCLAWRRWMKVVILGLVSIVGWAARIGDKKGGATFMVNTGSMEDIGIDILHPELEGCHPLKMRTSKNIFLVSRQNGTTMYEGCDACLRVEDKVFVIRGKPVLYECLGQEKVAGHGGDDFFGVHFVCQKLRCMNPYLPVAYRRKDIVCDTEAGRSKGGVVEDLKWR